MVRTKSSLMFLEHEVAGDGEAREEARARAQVAMTMKDLKTMIRSLEIILQAVGATEGL